MSQVLLSSYGFIHQWGFAGRDRALKNFTSDNTLIKWQAVSDKPCKRFGRLDMLSKYVLISVEMLNLPEPFGDSHADMAIILGTGYGSISVDMDYYHMAKKGASPRLFTYTLPNVAMAEVAIRYKIRGMNLCLMAGAKSGLLALWKGVKLIEQNEVTSCICIGADFLNENALAASQKIPFDTPRLSGFSWAFFLERNEEKGRISPLARISTKFTEIGIEERDSWQDLSRLCDFLMTPERTKKSLSLGSLYSLGIPQCLEVYELKRNGEENG